MADLKTSSYAHAVAVVDKIRDSFPEVWMGMRQRYVMTEAIAQAQAHARRETWEAAAQKCHECLDMTTRDQEKFDDPEMKQLMRGRCQAFANFESWLRQQAHPSGEGARDE